MPVTIPVSVAKTPAAAAPTESEALAAACCKSSLKPWVAAKSRSGPKVESICAQSEPELETRSRDSISTAGTSIVSTAVISAMMQA
jgi:hypothetical protein